MTIPVSKLVPIFIEARDISSRTKDRDVEASPVDVTRLANQFEKLMELLLEEAEQEEMATATSSAEKSLGGGSLVFSEAK